MHHYSKPIMYNFQRPVQQTLTGLESLRLFISWWWWLHLTEGSCTLWEKRKHSIYIHWQTVKPNESCTESHVCL